MNAGTLSRIATSESTIRRSLMVLLAFLMTHLITYQKLPFTSGYHFPAIPFTIFVIYGLFICETNSWNYRKLLARVSSNRLGRSHTKAIIATNLIACVGIFTALTIAQMILFKFTMDPFRFVGLLSVCLMISLIETGVFILRGINKNRNEALTLNRLAKNSSTTELSVVRNNELLKLSQSEIAYFKHHNGVIFLVTTDGKKIITQFDSLNEVESSLSDQFFRANRQVIVARDSVLSLQKLKNNKLQLRISHLEEIVFVSRYKSSKLKNWLKS